MAIGDSGRDRRRLGPCVTGAVAIHAAVFAWDPHRRANAAEAEEPSLAALDATNVDVEAAVPERDTKPPGGGAPTPGDPPVATARPLVPMAPRMAKAAAASPVPTPEPPRGDRGSSPASDEPSDDEADSTRAGLAAAQASDERRERGMAMAAAAWAGVGPGARGGPGGRGAGWGSQFSRPPTITEDIAFGNGRGGALTGRVCFLPVGTMRIADVHDCPYVATIYTDTLNIPERHFYDGFPGVSRRAEWFLIDYTGTFSVTVNGMYEFRLHSDDGSYLFIDDRMVIENDGKHAPESRSGSIPLAAGEHHIKVRYAQTDDRMALQLFVLVPGASSEKIFTTKL
jgi:hypothetical protein